MMTAHLPDLPTTLTSRGAKSKLVGALGAKSQLTDAGLP